MNEQLSFSDVTIDMKDPRCKSRLSYENTYEAHKPTEDQMAHIERMSQIIRKRFEQVKQRSFRIRYLGQLYRCTLIKSVYGELAICRKQPMDMIPLDEIGLPKHIIQAAMDERLCKGGLILVVGAIGSGKTTTCASIAVARTSEFGGMMLTIEDPAELPMQGDIGAGQCIQYEVESKDEFAEAGRLALRCFPSDKPGILFLGEIRDSEAATLALRASLIGKLVIATMHGDRIESALKRIISYASDNMSQTEVLSLLHNGFRMCLHQSRSKNKIDVKFLVDTTSAANTILRGSIEQLNSEIYTQLRMVENSEVPKPRQI